MGGAPRAAAALHSGGGSAYRCVAARGRRREAHHGRSRTASHMLAPSSFVAAMTACGCLRPCRWWLRSTPGATRRAAELPVWRPGPSRPGRDHMHGAANVSSAACAQQVQLERPGCGKGDRPASLCAEERVCVCGWGGTRWGAGGRGRRGAATSGTVCPGAVRAQRALHTSDGMGTGLLRLLWRMLTCMGWCVCSYACLMMASCRSLWPSSQACAGPVARLCACTFGQAECQCRGCAVTRASSCILRAGSCCWTPCKAAAALTVHCTRVCVKRA